MSTPPNAPPRPLMRLADLLGARPDPERSNAASWYLVVLGAAMVALNARPGAGWGSPGEPYTQLVALSLALMLASLGASGLLLRRGNAALSRWFSVLQALTFFPIVVFMGLSLYEWLGVVGVISWSAFVVAVICFGAARRRRRDRGGHAG